VQALVVYESVFGNTRQVAEAVARGLTGALPATLVEVTAAPATLPDDLDLLVVGGPTHALGMSRPTTRRDGAEQAGRDYDADAIGIREWIEGLAPARGTAAATFDTRVRRPRVPGSAAHRAAARLRRLGFRMLGSPTTFWVDGVPGPLLADELDRARRWGEELGARFAPARDRTDGGTVTSG
jgi:hypothetical protein